MKTGCLRASSALFGLISALAAQQPAPQVAVAAGIDSLRAHYGAALVELRGADTSHLLPEQLALRLSLINSLEDYVARGDFGRDPTPEDRENLFRDGQGRLCAVACLLHATGEDALIERIAAERNRAFVLELVDVPGLAEWLAAVGLTAEEAARVQGPAAVPPPPPPPAPVSHWLVGSKAGESRRAPAATTSAAPAGASAASGTSGPGRGGRTRTVDDGRDDPVTGGVPVEDWWQWWELNKSAWLPPGRLNEQKPAGQDRLSPLDTPPQELCASVTADLLPRLRTLLRDEDAAVRAASAVALGRLGGDAAVPDLLPLLQDSVLSVREAAILALGATGGMDGAHALLALAQDGALDEAGSQAVCASARPLAIVALGIARRRGLSASVDAFVVPFLEERGDETHDVREATLLGLDLARSPMAAPCATSMLAGTLDEPSLACRAIEVLGGSGDPAHLPALLHRAGARDLEPRRAACLALGGFSDPLLAAALQTSFEVEKEPLARGFLMLSLGAQEGVAARDFLVRTAADGPVECRPWAALGMGLLARRSGDTAARDALRHELPKAGESQGAWVLACGLARDAQAASELVRLLQRSANPRVRHFAALALAMTGAPDAGDVLADRFARETSPLARVGLAQGLGVLGRPQDAELLLAELRELRAPALAAQVAAALGFHGSRKAVEGLAALVADPDASSLARAAAVDALGLLLDRHEPLLLAEVARGRSFTSFPDWLSQVLPTTTL